jgi:hypothetical protein
MSFTEHGLPQGNQLILNEGTLLLGPMGDMLDLEETTHSVGMLKGLTIQNTRNFTALQAGVRQRKVANILTEDSWMITADSFEYSARQLSYLMGGDGSKYSTQKVLATTTTAAVLTGASTMPVASAADLAVGTFIIVEQANDKSGMIYRIESITANSVTLDRPTVLAYASGAKVHVVESIQADDVSCNGATYLSAKIMTHAADCTPFLILAAKVQITSGINLKLGADGYASTPIEITVLTPSRQDASYDMYVDFLKGKEVGMFSPTYERIT